MEKKATSKLIEKKSYRLIAYRLLYKGGRKS